MLRERVKNGSGVLKKRRSNNGPSTVHKGAVSSKSFKGGGKSLNKISIAKLTELRRLKLLDFNI